MSDQCKVLLDRMVKRINIFEMALENPAKALKIYHEELRRSLAEEEPRLGGEIRPTNIRPECIVINPPGVKGWRICRP